MSEGAGFLAPAPEGPPSSSLRRRSCAAPSAPVSPGACGPPA